MPTTSLERVKKYIANHPEKWAQINRANVLRWQKRQTAFNQESKRLRNISC